MLPDPQLGEFGEQEARSRLERALCGTGLHLSGFSDKGIDLILQFEAPGPTKQPLHFGVQIKTGDSYAESVGSHWRIKNINEARFQQWTRSKLPMIFVWVKPSTPCQCYWSFVRPNTPRSHFFISKRSIISPSLRFDLALEYGVQLRTASSPQFKLLHGPLSIGLRSFAKEFYRRELMTKRRMSPFAGEVTFSWHGWRHLTKQGRKPRYIHQSLQLLTVASWAVENPDEFLGIRPLVKTLRGNWVTEVRLLIFRTRNVDLASRPAATIITVLRECLSYPRDWMTDVRLHKNIRREVHFESIYEKAL